MLKAREGRGGLEVRRRCAVGKVGGLAETQNASESTAAIQGPLQTQDGISIAKPQSFNEDSS